jgi:curved DNA-binding protein CbpA
MTDKLDFIHDSEVFIDLYSVLDVDIEAKSEVIKSAYLKLVKIHHPDHGGNTEMYQQITRAYEILYNKESRKDYDLYYLKRSMDEFSRGDDLFRLKNDYKNYVDANTKPISEERLNDLYADIFKDKEKYIEKKIEKNEIEQRINDIELERKNEDIESTDEKITKIINELNGKLDIPITISEFFEYYKHKNAGSKSDEIILRDLGTLDTLPGYGSNYSSYMSDCDSEYFSSNFYSNISDDNNFINNVESISTDDFDSWRNSKKSDTKLSQSDIESYLLRRRNEESDILNEVETTLTNVSKRKEVKKFLKNKHINEEINKIDSTDSTDLKNTNNIDNIDNKEKILESTENIQEKPKENEIYITKNKNVRKRDLV